MTPMESAWSMLFIKLPSSSGRVPLISSPPTEEFVVGENERDHTVGPPHDENDKRGLNFQHPRCFRGPRRKK